MGGVTVLHFPSQFIAFISFFFPILLVDTYALLNDAVSSPDYMVLNGEMIGE